MYVYTYWLGFWAEGMAMACLMVRKYTGPGNGIHPTSGGIAETPPCTASKQRIYLLRFSADMASAELALQKDNGGTHNAPSTNHNLAPDAAKWEWRKQLGTTKCANANLGDDINASPLSSSSADPKCRAVQCYVFPIISSWGQIPHASVTEAERL